MIAALGVGLLYVKIHDGYIVWQKRSYTELIESHSLQTRKYFGAELSERERMKAILFCSFSCKEKIIKCKSSQHKHIHIEEEKFENKKNVC